MELWSGVEAIVSAAKAIGLAARAFDKDRIRGVTDTADPNTTEDILLEAGFRRALSLVLRIRQVRVQARDLQVEQERYVEISHISGNNEFSG